MSTRLGTWYLVSGEHQLTTGEKLYPLTQAAKGILVYADDGHMSVALMSPNRLLFKSPDLFGGSQSEKASAAEGPRRSPQIWSSETLPSQPSPV